VRKRKRFTMIPLYFFIMVTLVTAYGGATGTTALPYTVPETVLIKAGAFMMGNTRNDREGDMDERPVREIEITYNYEIGKYELTNVQFLEFLNDAGISSSGYHKGYKVIDMNDIHDWAWEFEYSDEVFRLKDPEKKKHPVINVTWYDAIYYCNWLSAKEGFATAYDRNGNLLNTQGLKTEDITQVQGYRLPTEAEWEYAAKGAKNDAGSSTDYKYAGSNDIEDVGWYWKNSGAESLSGEWCIVKVLENNNWTHEIGQKAPNEIGLYDMSGNVWEWCHDFYYSSYKSIPGNNPINLIRSTYRIGRGGSWFLYAKSSRVSNRFKFYPFLGDYDIGFRIARTVINRNAGLE